MRHSLVDRRAKFYHSFLPFTTKSDGSNGSRTVTKIEHEGVSVLCTLGKGESLFIGFRLVKTSTISMVN